nr:heterogeneous nuclear ribonucleoprotein Q-like [Kogia breviceps]
MNSRRGAGPGRPPARASPRGRACHPRSRGPGPAASSPGAGRAAAAVAGRAGRSRAGAGRDALTRRRLQWRQRRQQLQRRRQQRRLRDGQPLPGSTFLQGDHFSLPTHSQPIPHQAPSLAAPRGSRAPSATPQHGFQACKHMVKNLI